MPSNAPKSRSRSRSSVRTRMPSSAVASSGGRQRPVEGRAQGGRRTLVLGQRGQPGAQRPGLGAAGVGERDVGVADVELEPARARLLRLRVGDVAHALAVPHQPDHRRCRLPVAHLSPPPSGPPCATVPDAGSPAAPPRNRNRCWTAGSRLPRMADVTVPTDLPVPGLLRPGRAGGMARGGGDDRTGPLREDRQEGHRRPVGQLGADGRGAALLRLDRRPGQPARRLVLPPAHHAPAAEERVVGEERRDGRAADRRGADAPRRTGRGRCGQGRRTVGARLRGPGHSHGARRLRRGAGRRARGTREFETLDSPNRYAVLWRVHTANTPALRAKRIANLVQMLAEGRRIH